MTALTTWPADDPARVTMATTDAAEIGAVLGGLGFRFERWPLVAGVPPTAPAEDVLAAYRDPIARRWPPRASPRSTWPRCTRPARPASR